MRASATSSVYPEGKACTKHSKQPRTHNSRIAGVVLPYERKKPKTCEEAIEAGVCTYVATGKIYAAQWWSECRTCGLTGWFPELLLVHGTDIHNLEGNMGFCESCAQKCHAGHDVFNRKWGAQFYCDCGESGNCQGMS